MGIYENALSRLLTVSRQYRHHPTDANRQAFYRALEVVKRLELERSGIPAPETAVSDRPAYRSPVYAASEGRLNRARGPAQRHMSTTGIISFIISLLLIALLGISLINKTTQEQFLLARESTLEFKVTELFLTAQAAALTVAPTPSETFVCGGDSRTPRQPGTFFPSLGLTNYTVEQNSVGLRSDAVRALALDERGIWVGHPAMESSPSESSLVQFNRETWEHCGARTTNLHNINEITIDASGQVWVATDGFGVFVWNGDHWQNFTTHDGLPDNKTYTIVPDAEGNIWVGTGQGIAKYDGTQWSAAYTLAQRDTLINNYIHALAFHPAGELWVGYISAGLSRLTAEGEWIHYSAAQNPDALQSDNVRSLLVDLSGDVWVATDGGDISRYNFEKDEWQQYTTSIGAIPDNAVYDLALDGEGRVWAAGRSATSYFDGSQWHLYAAVNANVIGFGPACVGCPYNDAHVWLGTSDRGLTHSRLPDVSPVIEVTSVLYPRTVAPGEVFSPRIRVRTLPGYELRDDRGDGLFYTGTLEEDRFGAWPIIPIRGLVGSEESYEFNDYENPFVAPDEPGDYLSTWRVWQGGRLVGPEIRIEFRVAAPEATDEASPEALAATDEPGEE